jgi:uncharacterized protein YndB with AHSA1/START domain
MEKLRYTIAISAPVHTVWTRMLDDRGYREWTSAFQRGSHFAGSWEPGSIIRFLAPGDGGSMSGMIATVVENRPDEFVSIEYRGQVVDGVDDTTSDLARRLAGAHENYSFDESGGTTTVTVETDSDDEFAEMFEDAWPKALAALKVVSERRPEGFPDPIK